MSKTSIVDLKTEFKTVESVEQAIALDNQFKYWFLPQNTKMVSDFRECKCNMAGCKSCKNLPKDILKQKKLLPKAITMTLTNGNGKENFRLNESQIDQIEA